MTWLIGHWTSTWAVAAKAVLLYATALAGLRFGTRRTLAQMSLFDFVAAVAMGAIIGRTATSASTSYLQGAVAVLALIAVHRLVSLLRYRPALTRFTDYRPRPFYQDIFGMMWNHGMTLEGNVVTAMQHIRVVKLMLAATKRASEPARA